MDRTALTQKLKVVVATYTEDKAALEQLDESTDFIRDLKINSANLVDIVLDLEEEFNIEIDNESMEKMLTIRAALDVIEAKIAGA